MIKLTRLNILKIDKYSLTEHLERHILENGFSRNDQILIALHPEAPVETSDILSCNLPNVTPTFQGRESHLAAISDKFNAQIESGTSPLVFITGAESAGKTELAKSFANKFVHEENAFGIWIDGKEGKLERNLTEFSQNVLPCTDGMGLSSIVPILHNSIRQQTSNSCILYVFDAVDDDVSCRFLHLLLQVLSHLPLTQDPLPFVLVTTRDEKLNPVAKINLRLDHWMAGNLPFIVTHLSTLTPQVLEGFPPDQIADGVAVCDNIISAFTQLATGPPCFPPTRVVAASFSLLSLAVHFISSFVLLPEFFSLWTNYVHLDKSKSSDPVLLTHILNVFNPCLAIVPANGDQPFEVIPPSPIVVAVVRAMFAKSPLLRGYLAKALDVRSPTVHEKWFIVKLMPVVASSVFNHHSKSIHPSMLSVCREVLQDDSLIIECKSGVSTFCRTPPYRKDLLETAYLKFTQLFGPEDEETMQILKCLAFALYNQSDPASKSMARIKYGVLYETALAKYGIRHETTEKAYHAILSLLQSVKEVVTFWKDIIAKLETEVGPSHEKTVKEKLSLALYLVGVGAGKEAGRLLRDLLPICEQYHPNSTPRVRMAIKDAKKLTGFRGCWRQRKVRVGLFGLVIVLVAVFLLLRMLRVY